MTPAVLSKSDLRAQLRLRRRELFGTHPDAGERAAAHLPLDNLPPFSVVSGYLPFAGEIDPWPVLRRLRKAGADIALPVVQGRGKPLVFRAYGEGDPLELDAGKIQAPVAAALSLVPDLLITPLLAFDRDGHRLGQGAGYYDMTLDALRRDSSIWVVGLAYAGQQIDRVPREAHDQPLDAILTETGYHAFRKDN
jgi:5-formyltetrahydrofolate cyclo-ligase